MELSVLGSSSRGNCYILQDSDEALIIEAGVAISNILEAVSYKVDKVVGCIVSHEHKDHSKSVEKLQSYGVKCYMSKGTSEGVKYSTYPEIVENGKQFSIGSFSILPFDTHHDSNEPLGYLISHKSFGTLLFAIDTCYLPYTFADLSNIMIECNYSEDILDRNVKEGVVHPIVRKHIAKSHMSLQTCKEALQANDLTKVDKVILLHLSKDNGDAERFKTEVAQAVGKDVLIAEKGMKVIIGNTPFDYE